MPHMAGAPPAAARAPCKLARALCHVVPSVVGIRFAPPMASPHKILFVIPGLRQGGAERQLLELMRRLPARFAPTLCVYDGTNVHYGAELPPGEPRHVLGLERMT